MIAHATAVVEPGGVLGELACTPPLTLRQVRGDAAGRCELCLGGTAAGPLAGDDLSLSLRLAPGARATLRATGASLAQGGESALSMRAELGDGADLVACPGPLIVCGGSRVHASVELILGAGATVDWRELIVLGRTGEPPGHATLRWDVTRPGHPVLRQLTDLTDPDLTRWAGLLSGRRVLACSLLSGPEIVACTVVGSATAVAQRVADDTVLITVLGHDAAAAQGELDALCANVRHRP